MSIADEQSTHRTRQLIVLRLQELGAPDTEQQRHVCAVWTQGRARRRSELTERDAGSLYARLREMDAADLADVLARPAPVADQPAEVAESEPWGPPGIPWTLPPEPDPVPVEPPPVDVEAAAAAAVARFRERQAAGIVPEPPTLGSIPPRVPIELAPRPDRYCPPSICWCGTCAHWKPAPPVDYAKTPGSKDHEYIHGRRR